MIIEEILKEIKQYQFTNPMELIHIGQRQMSMIIAYIDKLQRENKILEKRLNHLLKSEVIRKFDSIKKASNNKLNIKIGTKEYEKDINWLDSIFYLTDVVTIEKLFQEIYGKEMPLWQKKYLYCLFQKKGINNDRNGKKRNNKSCFK